MTKTYRICVLACAVLLSACGFQLRGSGAVPEQWQPVYVSSRSPNGVLHQAVQREINQRGIRQTQASGEARLVLRIDGEDFSQRAVALDQRARVAEYALVEEVQLSLRDATEAVSFGPHPMMVRRRVVNDPDNPVGEQSEHSLIRGEMNRELARRLVDQLSYWSRQIPEKP